MVDKDLIVRHAINELPQNFEEYKIFIANNPYQAEMDDIWENYSARKMYKDSSEMVKSSVAFNMISRPYQFDFQQKSHVPVYESIDGNTIAQQEYLKTLSLNAAAMSGYNPYSMEAVDRLAAVNIWKPDGAQEVEVLSWDDVYLWRGTQTMYLYYASCVGKYENSGKGYACPTLGRYSSYKDRAASNNRIYQQNRLIAFPVKKNKTYYFEGLYPITNDFDDTGSSNVYLNKGITNVSTSSPYAPTYGNVYRSGTSVGNYCNHTFLFKQRPSFTVPAQNRSTRLLYSSYVSTTICPASRTSALSANAYRDYDIEYINSLTGSKGVQGYLIGESGSAVLKDVAYYRARIGGVSASEQTGENAYFISPSILSASTGNYSSIGNDSWIVLNTAKFTADGTTFNPVPKIYEL